MNKKLKNSVKTEMKKAVQKELSKIIAKQIAIEQSFQDLKQEIINDFFEDDVAGIERFLNNHKGENNPKLEQLSDIFKGHKKERFNELIDFPGTNLLNFETALNNNKPFSENVGLSSISKKVIPNCVTKQIINNNKDSSADSIIQFYKDSIEYSEKNIKKLFDAINLNKGKLQVTYTKNDLTESYCVKSTQDVFFGFELEIKTNKINSQKNIFLNNVCFINEHIETGIISNEVGQKLFDLVLEIYLSQKSNDKPKKRRRPRRKRRKIKINAK